MQRKKILSMLLCSGMVISAVLGSSVMVTASEDPAEAWKSQEITLTIISSHTEEAIKQIVSSAAYAYARDLYLEDYPNVTIEETPVADADYSALMLQYAAADDLPDLFWWEPGKAGTYVDGELLADITDYVDASLYSDNLMTATYDGKVYGIPMKASEYNYVYYNEALLEEATGSTEFPKTLEEFLALDEYFEGKGLDLIAYGNKGQWFAPNSFASAILKELCGDEWYEAFLQGKADMSIPEFAQACEWLQKIGDTCNKDFNAQDDGWALAWYVQGNAFCHVSGAWLPPTVMSYAEEYPEVVEKTKVAYLPSIGGTDEDRYLSASFGNIWGINSKIEQDSPEFYAAVEFLKYICGVPYAEYMISHGSIAPMSLDGVEAPEGALYENFFEIRKQSHNIAEPLAANLEASVFSVFKAEVQSLMDRSMPIEQFANDLQAAEDALP